ncbi:aminobenzoyl-glutamate transport protein [Georgenia satyanarayanai]|uniref:Aminobenzoyl-glutamate transport protein n=1 Tax=Georgenia satyanarayanai TaxID=860221 RepID=A0A2Y9A2J1_9MICO|nr:AbgT family transporter [Georgenia satyanarayanai]PYG01926.1 aminobenzoyl-glutamate transport protein [Georgenia satyanarayanai]SSA36729.1 aminobenzoyl-glutamate transport protein [Georgenia satyanarayanai]
MTAGTTASRRGWPSRLLDGVERVGNRLPEPFTLFLALFVIVAVASTVMAWAGVTVQIPGSDEVTEIRGLFTGEGLVWLTENLGANYVGFPPLVTVLPILLAVGVAEKSGMLAAAIRRLIGSAPRWALPYAVGVVGVLGSVLSDASFVVIPPLTALAFKAAGRHPVAGLIGGFAATGAGYSTNILVTSLDALFAGITQSVTGVLPNPGAPVNPVSNWFFNIAAALILMVLAGLLIDKVLEPRLTRQGVPQTERADEEDGAPSSEAVTAELTAVERRGLLWAAVAFALTAVAVVAAVAVPGSPWRNEEGGFLPSSPLLSSIVFLVFLLFLVPGLVYGWVVGTARSVPDVTTLMGRAVRDMIPFLVLAFVLGQFIALFNWSGIGSWIAVTGAEGLEAAGLTGFLAILLFVMLASSLNLFIISGSALWTLMAAVFVPMFALIGYEPAFIQAAFRVGDSATQILTPLNPYIIVLLTMLRRYEPKAGLGTIIARMLPFTVVFRVAWVLVLSVFFALDLPVGPGNGIFLDE